MKDLNEVACFTKVVEENSITAAARALGLPKSTVSRRVSALEKRLGVTLLRRTTRQINLTDAGKSYFETSRRALRELENAEARLSLSQESVQGLLRVTAPVEFSSGPLIELIGEFETQYPNVGMELLFTERVVDLVRENVDLALRMGDLKDSTLIARRLGYLDSRLVATPEYLKRHGTPKSPDDLDSHAGLGFAPGGGEPMPWLLRNETSRRQARPKMRLVSNHLLAVKSAALNHQGIALLPVFLFEREVAARELRELLPGWRQVGVPMHLVYPGQKFVPPKLRLFLSHLIENAASLASRTA